LAIHHWTVDEWNENCGDERSIEVQTSMVEGVSAHSTPPDIGAPQERIVGRKMKNQLFTLS